MLKLNILIPSYNRYSSLSNLLSQISSIYSRTINIKLKVIVYDNYSDDDRYLSLKACSFSFDFIYIRNQSNVGMANNISKCVSFSDNKLVDYFWILSDDDLITVDNLNFINSLTAKNPDLIYLRAGVAHEEEVDDIEYVNGMDYFIDKFSSYSMCGFLSTNIYASKFSNNFENVVRYNHTLFPHLANFFELLSKNIKNEEFLLLISPKKLGNIIIYTQNNRSYTENYYDAIIGMFDIANILDGKYAKKFRKKMIYDYSWSHYVRFIFKDFKFLQRLFSKLNLSEKILFLIVITKELFKRIIKHVSKEL